MFDKEYFFGGQSPWLTNVYNAIWLIKILLDITLLLDFNKYFSFLVAKECAFDGAAAGF